MKLSDEIRATKAWQAIQDLRETMVKYQDLGATDTEPMVAWADLAEWAVNLEDWEQPKPGYWQLFSTAPGWKRAERSLNSKAKKAYDAIQNSTMKEIKLLKEYYGDPGWNRWI